MILHHIPKKKILLLAGDIIAIIAACICAPALRFGVLIFEPVQIWPEITVITIVYIICFYIADLYNLEKRLTHSTYIYRFLGATLAAISINLITDFFIFRIELGRGIFIVNVALVFGLTFLWRLFFELVIGRLIRRQRNVLIIGAGESGYALYRFIKDTLSLRVAGFIDDDPKKNNNHNYPMVLGGQEALDEIVKREGIEQIIIAIRDIKNTELFRNLLNCKMKGVEIYNIPTFFEQMLGKIQVEYVTDFWFISIPIMGVKRSIYNNNIKRVIGIVLALVFLVIGLPFILVVSIAIKIDSKGPVFYKQKRVGLNGQIFKLVKFRSMTVDAEKNGAVWAVKKDDRVTRVGKIIRKLRIDEIPQMWNVLVGDMNFFGPRPERPEFVEMLKEKIPYYDLRHTVKPGITGWAQVNYPYGASVEDALEKLKYDLFYIKNLSPFLDFHILLRTVRVVLFGKGAR